jgi:hypothetical protein
MAPWRLKTWDIYDACGACGTPAGTPCVALGHTAHTRPGDPIVRPHHGRPQVVSPPLGRPSSLTKGEDSVYADRLMVWKRLASRGVLVADIAHQLGMKRAALDQFVVRARKAGHPDAVYHASVKHFWHTRTGRTRTP